VNTHQAIASGNPLPQGTQLQKGAFAIGKVLGQGGCGITYQAADLNLRRLVAIKEFFPPGCKRVGQQVDSSQVTDFDVARRQFAEEARVLARFSHRNIVNVLTIFDDNNTTYIVMEFLKGKSLEQVVEARGPLSEKQAVGCITQIAQALMVVHGANLIHRDIKPGNALVCEDGRVVLIDFGLNQRLEVPHNYQTRLLMQSAPAGTEGYAPPEQYLKDGVQGIATDIYACGATLYFLVTGKVPVSAPERAMGAPFPAAIEVNAALSKNVNQAISKAMEIKAGQRPQSVQEFMKLLINKAPATRKKQSGLTSPKKSTSATKSPRRKTASQPQVALVTPSSVSQKACIYCSHLNPSTVKLCESCGRRFYDPIFVNIVMPLMGTTFVVAAFLLWLWLFP